MANAVFILMTWVESADLKIKLSRVAVKKLPDIGF